MLYGTWDTKMRNTVPIPYTTYSLDGETDDNKGSITQHIHATPRNTDEPPFR